MKFLIMAMAILLLIINIQNIPLSFINAQSIHKPLPVLLIHGYASDESVWNDWKSFLDGDNIPYKSVTFTNNDSCGSAKDHAKELIKIVNDFKSETGSPKINIVAHSKGGLDTRVYLANNLSNANVANLVMIGTPNAGSPVADFVAHSPTADLAKFGNPFAQFALCTPALNDLETTASDTHAAQNPKTNYYTIAGNWTPFSSCSAYLIDAFPSNYLRVTLGLANDGIVPIKSVESQLYFHNLLPHSDNCHQDLLGIKEYNLAEPILLGKQ